MKKAILVVLAAGAPVMAQGAVEDFEDLQVDGGWNLGGAPGEVIEDMGGNPGGFLHSPNLDAAIVTAQTGIGAKTAFLGDWRAMGVTSFSADAITFAVNTAEGRPMSLVLVNDNDTPDDPFDDCFVYYVGEKNIPMPGAGWEHYAFDVPSGSQTLPPGWKVNFDCAFGQPPEELDKLWNATITDVDQVILWWHDPDFFAIFQMWDVGVDNLVLTAGCYADFNGDGALNILDFIAFQNAFVGGDPNADCNGDGALNVLDFVCFQDVFKAGCP
jgi:hypothetical protein